MIEKGKKRKNREIKREKIKERSNPLNPDEMYVLQHMHWVQNTCFSKVPNMDILKKVSVCTDIGTVFDIFKKYKWMYMQSPHR